MPVNPATKFAIRCALREAVNKSTPEYKGNNNRKNCRYVSSAALALMNDAGADLVADHAIPISLLQDRINKTTTREELVALVQEYCVMALITKAEDALLRAAGLVKKMPPGCDTKDPTARYRHVGIEVIPNPGFANCHS